jgi:copper chaperone CopZ
MITETRLTVRGMNCSSCESAVKRSLQRLDGVIRVDAGHAADRVDVRFDAERVSEEKIKDRIQAAGFETD